MSSAKGVAGRGGRSVPALYATLTSTLVVTVAVVASVVRPATPPSIAEFGPAPQERIEQARQDQAAGTAAGATGPNAAGPQSSAPPAAAPAGPEAPTVSSPAPSEVEVPATRRCFGDPPRQTEDPHSPPCVFELFEGDNGGATAPGVTGAEIRIAVPGFAADRDSDIARVEPLINHFNRRYEFYGRRLTPVFVDAFKGESTEESSTAGNLATAEDIIAVEPFGVASRFEMATNAVMYQRLAQARIHSAVSGTSGPPQFNSAAVANGFTWLLDPPLDERLRAGARLVCRALAGRPASHAGVGIEGQPRKFAVVVEAEGSGVRPDVGPLLEGLRGCGVNAERFDVPPGHSQEDYHIIALQLRQGGFTTVLPSAHIFLYQAATDVGYYPEWLDLGTRSSHTEGKYAGFQRSFTAGQGEHTFGITPEVRLQSDRDAWSMWAYRDGGGTDAGARYQHRLTPRYAPLLVLAAGIQGAGPNLTPETFAQALQSTRFPNPSPGAPPFWQQRISFGPGDPVFHDDYAIWWWNENAPSQTNTSNSGRGSFCYLDRGGRFTPDTFPEDADDRLFNTSEPCR